MVRKYDLKKVVCKDVSYEDWIEYGNYIIEQIECEISIESKDILIDTNTVENVIIVTLL